MGKITRAMENQRDEEFRSQHNRDFWGTDIDDYMRRLTGKESYYEEKTRRESDRYWADYAKNTEVEPRYPIMAGKQQNMAASGLPLGLTQLPGQFKAIDMLYGGMR